MCQGASWHLGMQILQHGCIGQIAAVACIHNYPLTQKREMTSVISLFCIVERLEKLNTSVRWTLVPSRLDGMDSLIYRVSPLGLYRITCLSSNIMLYFPYRHCLNSFYWRMLFEKQHLGDCRLTGRLATCNFTKPPGIAVNNHQEEKQ